MDLKRDLKKLYSPPGRDSVLVEVPDLAFLQVDGDGDPNGAVFQEALGALYGTVYTLKFGLKKAGIDYPVMPLEGLWWADSDLPPSEWTKDASRESWRWTAMIAQPDFLTEEHLEAARVQLAAKRGPSAALERLRLVRFEEGLCAQILHLGPYSAEEPTITRLHDFIRDCGRAPRGKHHEIYLGDPRRAAPEKLRTLIRQPVTSVPIDEPR